MMVILASLLALMWLGDDASAQTLPPTGSPQIASPLLDWRGDDTKAREFYSGEAGRVSAIWRAFELGELPQVKAIATDNITGLLSIPDRHLNPGDFLWAPGFSADVNKPARPLSTALCQALLKKLAEQPGSLARSHPRSDFRSQWGATGLPDWIDEGFGLYCAPDEVHEAMWQLLREFGPSASYDRMLNLPHPAYMLRAYHRPGTKLKQLSDSGRAYSEATPSQSDYLAFQLFDATSFAMFVYLLETQGPAGLRAVLAGHMDTAPNLRTSVLTSSVLARTPPLTRSETTDFSDWLTFKLTKVSQPTLKVQAEPVKPTPPTYPRSPAEMLDANSPSTSPN
jgi:hypothetical protein